MSIKGVEWSKRRVGRLVYHLDSSIVWYIFNKIVHAGHCCWGQLMFLLIIFAIEASKIFQCDPENLCQKLSRKSKLLKFLELLIGFE